VLGGLAEFEHDLIRARTAGGREPAEAGGVKLGRKSKLTPHQQQKPGGGRRLASRSVMLPAATTSTSARFRGWLHIERTSQGGSD
jgi:DNA invertase Pin-like site-specific DNA recombinase